MSKEPTTIYSNVINVRTSPTELIFEFGNHFPSSDQSASAPPPADFPIEVRVVMPMPALKALAGALGKAAAKQAGNEAEGQPPAQQQAKIRK